MPEQESPIRAAIDIGSNTIHIVVAHCRPDTLDIIAEETAMVRIGESVNATGEISPQKQEEALTILQRYQEVARQHKAEEVLAVATEAIRKARNSAEFLKQVQQKIGLQVQI